MAAPINAVKQAAEFGIVKGGQSLAGLLVLSADVAALGLSVAQGLVLTEDWYWDLNEPSRAWTKRWQAERSGRPLSRPAAILPLLIISRRSNR
jgi:branched-chain amino acid transport system substrate-binding protein